MWTLTGDDVASKPRREIRTAKFMFTITWNPRGFHVIDKLPDGVTMNANYFTENILGSLEEKCSRMEGQGMEYDLSCIWTTLPFTIAR
jgi:hypothetical protein